MFQSPPTSWCCIPPFWSWEVVRLQGFLGDITSWNMSISSSLLCQCRLEFPPQKSVKICGKVLRFQTIYPWFLGIRTSHVHPRSHVHPLMTWSLFNTKRTRQSAYLVHALSSNWQRNEVKSQRLHHGLPGVYPCFDGYIMLHQRFFTRITTSFSPHSLWRNPHLQIAVVVVLVIILWKITGVRKMVQTVGFSHLFVCWQEVCLCMSMLCMSMYMYVYVCMGNILYWSILYWSVSKTGWYPIPKVAIQEQIWEVKQIAYFLGGNTTIYTTKDCLLVCTYNSS